MPIYEYQCDECGCRFEVRQSYSDAPVTQCKDDKCRGKVHKVFSPPAIIFKGSGFHVTDYGRGNGRRKTESKPCDTGDKGACKGCERSAAGSSD